jgi:hypothetical protein
MVVLTGRSHHAKKWIFLKGGSVVAIKRTDELTEEQEKRARELYQRAIVTRGPSSSNA